MKIWTTHGSGSREWRLTNRRGRQIAALIFSHYAMRRSVGIVLGSASIWISLHGERRAG